jgi:integrase
MKKHHPKNERIKRAYLSFLEEAKRMSRQSANDAAAAIALFEASTGWKDFAAFHIEQAKRFKRTLTEEISTSTGKPLAKATIRSRLMALRGFFAWLAEQPGYKSRISRTDCDYFNLSANDSRIATARRERAVPDIGQIRHVLDNMPSATAVEKRDRALVAFTLLSGARDDAIASLSVRHVDLERRTVFQDARTVRTKNRKTFTSGFFPVGEDVEAIVQDWIAFLRGQLLFGPDDPLFPATKVGFDDHSAFAAVGLERRHWKDAGAIRRIFREAFEAQGLPYYNPHSFRKTLTRLGQKARLTQEQEKAWSQNLGHEHIRTTQNSYGEVPGYRQVEIMDGLRARPADGTPEGEPDSQTIQRVVDYLSRKVGKG